MLIDIDRHFVSSNWTAIAVTGGMHIWTPWLSAHRAHAAHAHDQPLESKQILMIVGKGMLARAFEPYFGDGSDIVVFASGVSNSLETRTEQFAREEALLRQQLGEACDRFVYFSSCGVTGAESEITPYMRHKREMEALVLASPLGLVLRLPQVVGVTNNTHTLTNFLRDHISSGDRFTVWSTAERNIVDIDDVVKIGSALAKQPPAGVAVVSIAAARSIPMTRLVEIFEGVLNRTANCSYVDKGSRMDIDTDIAETLSRRIGIDLGGNYIERVIMKYYGTRTTEKRADFMHARGNASGEHS